MTATSLAPRSRGGGSPRPMASVAMGFVAGMLSGMTARGLDPRPLLAAAEIEAGSLDNPEARVSLSGYADLYNRVVLSLSDEGFGLFHNPVPSGSFEFLCRSVVSSRTLGEALDRIARFLRLVLPDLSVSVERDAKLALISIRELPGLGLVIEDPRRVFAFEWLLRVIHGLACWLAGRSLALNSVEFPYAPPGHVSDYALIYTEHSRFGGDMLTASLNANLLDLPVRRDEAALQEFLAGMPGKISMLYRRDREAVRIVRDMLLAAFPESPSLEDVAQRLYLSPRTLHRRLHEEGSSYRMIKDALRRDLALAAIEKKRLGVGQIAAELGFADTSTFFRAFRKWTGEAPSIYKKRLD